MATQTTGTEGDTESALKVVQAKIGEHETLIKYLLIGIVGSIILLAFNLYQDRNTNDRLTNFATEAASSRMTLSENEISYLQRVIVLEKDLSIFKQCLKLGGWKECFD